MHMELCTYPFGTLNIFNCSAYLIFFLPNKTLNSVRAGNRPVLFIVISSRA